jgi:spermidine synthase
MNLSRRPALRVPFLLFFASGAAALIYETVWVREFGRFLGNTSMSVALVTGLFVGGVGLGSFFAGRAAVLRRAGDAGRLWRLYAACEGLIGLVALATWVAQKSLLAALPARTASYELDDSGLWVLTQGSVLAQLGVLAVLVLPATLLMGATFPLLLRITRESYVSNGWGFGLLYGSNTAGAMAGCLSVDLWLVPQLGSRGTQLCAIAVNILVGLVAWGFARYAAVPLSGEEADGSGTPLRVLARQHQSEFLFVCVVVAISGFVAMGLQVVWARFLTTALGGTRGVFSILLGVILGGMWLGSIAGGWSVRRWRMPWVFCGLGSVLLVASSMMGLLWFDRALLATGSFAGLHQTLERYHLSWLIDVLFVLRTVLPVAGLASFWAGFTVPPAIEILNFDPAQENRLTSIAYMVNCLGALLGAVGVGFFLLPGFGMQATVLLLAFPLLGVALSLIVMGRRGWAGSRPAGLAAAATLSLLLGYWNSLSPQYLLLKVFDPPRRKEGFLALSEDLNESIAVDEHPITKDRYLLTNGHSMSGTALGSVRYMRMFSHLPLLQMAEPKDALVICFGVGNTLHAASLYPSVSRLEVVDLSRHVIEHADYFAEWNRQVLRDPRVRVFINDGRHHLQMQPPGSYDLVTLEPPPLAHSGVASLYTREFYDLVRSRLRSGGFLTTWLPALQLTEPALRSAIGAFVEVFPNAVLLHGHADNFILMGRAAETNTVELSQLENALSRHPEVRADLDEVFLGTMTELLGTFVASSGRLSAFSRGAAPLTDDQPNMDYGYIAFLRSRVPSGMIGVRQIGDWYKGRDLDPTRESSLAPGLPTYLAIMENYYSTIPPIDYLKPRVPHRLTLDLTSPEVSRVIERSPYLQGVLRAQLQELGAR